MIGSNSTLRLCKINVQKNIPNLITLSRLVLCPFIIHAFFRGHFSLTVGLLIVASLSDALDGYLSRRWGATSALGAVLDPLSDKLYTISLFTSLMLVGQCPIWFLGLIITASMLQIGGIVLLRLPLTRARPVIQPSRIGKLSTALQMIWILILVTENLAVRHGMTSPFSALIFWTGFSLLGGLQVMTFCQYAFRYRTRLIPGLLQPPAPRG